MNYFVFGAGMLFFAGSIQSVMQGQWKLAVINFGLGIVNATLATLK